jgi:hypothetical protein
MLFEQFFFMVIVILESNDVFILKITIYEYVQTICSKKNLTDQ